MLTRIFNWWHSYSRSTRKRWYIGIVYGLLASAFIFSIYNAFFAVHPTCSDGVKNGAELDVDCGGICSQLCLFQRVQKIRILEKAAIPTKPDYYDLYTVIQNPNPTSGIEDLRYTFEVFDGTGASVAKRSGRTFLLPNAEKYIVEPAVKLEEPPAQVNITFQPISWRDLTNYIQPEVFARNKEIHSTPSLEQSGMELTGLVNNKSDIDFQDIVITVIVREQFSDEVVAVNRTDMQTLRASEERRFVVNWPFTFSASSPQIEVQAETNVFDNDNFIRESGITVSDPFFSGQ